MYSSGSPSLPPGWIWELDLRPGEKDTEPILSFATGFLYDLSQFIEPQYTSVSRSKQEVAMCSFVLLREEQCYLQCYYCIGTSGQGWYRAISYRRWRSAHCISCWRRQHSQPVWQIYLQILFALGTQASMSLLKIFLPATAVTVSCTLACAWAACL